MKPFFLRVFCVELADQLLVETKNFERADSKTSALNPLQNLTDMPFTNRVWLDHEESLTVAKARLRWK